MGAQQNIDDTLYDLGKFLKIDTNEHDWRKQIDKELKGANLSYKIYRVFGLVIMIGAGILMVVTFFTKGEAIFGIEIKEKYFHSLMLVVFISNFFILGGKSQLKLDRLKTFLLLHDLRNGAK